MLLTLDGNDVAYRKLLQELSNLLKPYFRRHLFNGATEAEDLVQETLLAIHTRRITFNPDMALLPWVRAIARYKLVDYLRRVKRQASVPLDDELVMPDQADASEARMDVDVLLGSLSGRTASLIRNVKIEGQSIDEAAYQTKMSQSAVKVAIHRGLGALAERLGVKKR